MKTENNKIKTWTTKRIKPKTYWGTCAIFVVALFLILLGVCELIRWGFRYEEQKQREKFEEYEEVEQAIKSQRKVQAVAFRETRLSDETIINGIIGEAIGEPATGIIAVAWVLRNRLDAGMSVGFCALNREDLNFFIWRQPEWKKDLVEDIWNKVKAGKIADPTGGALYFENEIFGDPMWINDVELVAVIGNHNFYR